jgi:tRNA pseudouridine38-40 synthase
MHSLVSPSPTIKCFRLWVAYRGDAYCGFQSQTNGPTIQDALTQALKSITQQDITLSAAGRTDAGVHAHGQVVSFTVATRLSSQNFLLALPQKLPKDLAVWRVDEMPLQFDARFHSVGKQYIYRIYQGPVADPFLRLNSWHLRQNLNVEAMHEAAQFLVGEHDYESFRGVACTASHARRYLWKLDVSKLGPMIEFDVRGNAFCLNMVRILVGTLVEVGLGKRAPKDLPALLAERDRRRAGQTARPEGLTFNRVYYPDDLSEAQIPPGATFPRFPVTPLSWPF